MRSGGGPGNGIVDFLRCLRGAIAVEFALIFPILILIIFLVIELGHALYIHNAISYAVQEGTRYAMIRGSTSTSPATEGEISDIVLGRLVGVDTDNVTVEVTFNPDNTPGSTVEVLATFPYTPSLS